nr:DUF397 domain-containing protein [Actinomadura oligospora]
MRDDSLRGLPAIVWRKSSYSTATGEDCVEVAALPDHQAGLRDSKDPEGPRLSLTPADWQALTHRTKCI